MNRDYTQFPEDENGAILWHMKSRGDDLSKPREVDLSVIFPTEQAALRFAVMCLRSGFKVAVAESEEPHKDGLNWDVSVYATMAPNHADITMLETSLGEQAKALEGRNDGWAAIFIRSQ